MSEEKQINLLLGICVPKKSKRCRTQGSCVQCFTERSLQEESALQEERTLQEERRNADVLSCSGGGTKQKFVKLKKGVFFLSR